MSLLEHIQARWRQVAENLPQERSANKILTTLLGLLGAFGRRTVTGSLVYLGLSQQDWSGRYRHFSRSPWSQDAIFRVACKDAAALVPAELPFIPISLDDTWLLTTGTLGGLASWSLEPRPATRTGPPTVRPRRRKIYRSRPSPSWRAIANGWITTD